MVTEIERAEQTSRLLWSHAACQVISVLPASDAYEPIYAGFGSGVRSTNNRQHAILIHPTADGRELGELSVTVRDKGTQIIPRCNADFIQYIHNVTDVVETVVRAYIVQ